MTWIRSRICLPARPHNRTQLLDRVWGDHVFIEERTVDVHVKRLRETLSAVNCEHMIETVRGARLPACQSGSSDDGLTSMVETR